MATAALLVRFPYRANHFRRVHVCNKDIYKSLYNLENRMALPSCRDSGDRRVRRVFISVIGSVGIYEKVGFASLARIAKILFIRLRRVT